MFPLLAGAVGLAMSVPRFVDCGKQATKWVHFYNGVEVSQQHSSGTFFIISTTKNTQKNRHLFVFQIFGETSSGRD
jgi:hypothetical protein